MLRSTTVIAVMLAVSCSKGPETSNEAAGSAQPSAEAKKPRITTNKKPEGPRFKESDAPPDGKLGILPEGIGLPIGNEAPEAALKDADGKSVQLSELYEKGAVLLVFYRGGWCPYCNFQVRALAKGMEEFKKRGVMPVVVSVDKVDEATKTKKAYDIEFPTLSDPKLVAHEAYRVVNEVDDKTYKKLGGYGIDLEKSSGEKHHKIAVPAIFLIVDGLIKWAHADTDYKVRPKNEQLLAMLDSKGLAPK